MKIEEIRQLSLTHAFGGPAPAPPVADERWIDAYGEALLVSGYQGFCTFELDGIVVTILEPQKALDSGNLDSYYLG